MRERGRGFVENRPESFGLPPTHPQMITDIIPIEMIANATTSQAE